MYRTKAIYQLSDLKQSSWKILRLFEIYRQSGSQAPVRNYLNKVLKYLKKGHCTVVYYYTLFTFKNRNTNNLKDIEYYEIQI